MPRPPLLRGPTASPRQISRRNKLPRISSHRARHMHASAALGKDTTNSALPAREDAIMSKDKKSMLEILEERGYIKDIAGSRASLDNLLSTKRIAAYAGIDPTAPSLHLGHLLPFMVLFHLHINGYPTVSLLGGATAKVGDPTGRLTSRSAMDTSTRLSNLTSMSMQVKGIWSNLAQVANKHGYKKDSTWRKDFLNNNSWLSKLTIVDFLGVLGKGARMGTMMGRDTVKNKMAAGDGMSFAEFTYPLLQAWDWWHMYKHHNVQLQIGGSDQYGNIVAGMDAIKYIATAESSQLKEPGPMEAPYGITVPLLTTASGAKFGKSAGNAVWLDKDLTSPFDLYGFLLRSSDEDVPRYLRLFTFLPLSKISEIITLHNADPGKRIAQHLLAREVLELVHGSGLAKETESQHRLLRNPSLASLTTKPTTTDPTDPNDSSSPTPSSGAPLAATSVRKITLPKSLVLRQSPARLLYHASLAPSRAHAARLIKSGGAYIGANTTWHSAAPMPDAELSFRPLKSVTEEMIEGYVAITGVLVLRVGKWKVRVVDVVDDDVFEEMELKGSEGGVESSPPGWKEWKAARDEVQSVKDIFSKKSSAGKKSGSEEPENPNVVDLGKEAKDGKWRGELDMWRTLDK